jgi:ABC-type Fe3+ transport system permease subunit
MTRILTAIAALFTFYMLTVIVGLFLSDYLEVKERKFNLTPAGRRWKRRLELWMSPGQCFFWIMNALFNLVVRGLKYVMYSILDVIFGSKKK